MVNHHSDTFDKFAILRVQAINAYGQLEQAQLSLFAALLGADMIKAATVLAAMQNARSRHIVIQDLLRISQGDKYKKFYAKLQTELSKLDGERNKIVHWMEMGAIIGGGEFNPERDIFLAEHPNLFGLRKVHASDLRSFVNRTHFYSRLVFKFAEHLQRPNIPVAENKTPWREIFLRPPQYPPEPDHPLHPISTISLPLTQAAGA